MGTSITPNKTSNKSAQSDTELQAELLGIPVTPKIDVYIAKRKSIFERFAVSATFLGFIVDSITMISILFAVSVGGVSVLSVPLTPFHAVIVWILASFTYMGILHKYWTNNQDKEQLNPDFWLFLSEDLIKGFKNPFLLLPVVFSVVMFVWIFVELILFSTFVAIIVTILFILFIMIVAGSASYVEPPEEKVKKSVDNNWKMWDKRIQAEFLTRSWIDTSHLSDMSEVLGVDHTYLKYALANYATRHSRTAKYTTVYRTSDRQSLGKLLVSTKKPLSGLHY